LTSKTLNIGVIADDELRKRLKGSVTNDSCSNLSLTPIFFKKGETILISAASGTARQVADDCPDGVDVYLDNTAGSIHDTAMLNRNSFGRVMVIGTIAFGH
jgi:NADPH-dependent curcumin reductase CurA